MRYMFVVIQKAARIIARHVARPEWKTSLGLANENTLNLSRHVIKISRNASRVNLMYTFQQIALLSARRHRLHLLLQQKIEHSKSIIIGKMSKKAMRKNMICKFRIGSDESKPKSAIVSLSAKLSYSR